MSLGGLVMVILAAVFISRSIISKEKSAFEVDKAKLESELGFARKELDTQERVHKEAMEALERRFDETVAKVSAQLKDETSNMLKQRQKEFSETSNQSLGQIMNPLKENIAALKKVMEDGKTELAERSGQMKGQIQSLLAQSEAARKSADELAAAFKHGIKMQGDWGETILEELLSAQGLTKGIHFDTQAVIYGADGKAVRTDANSTLRPDVILHLDEQREVIIDSKVSLTAYVDYVNAENEADRQMFLRKHLESIRKHVKELSAKDYSSYIQAPKVSVGYVIMFIPNIGALWTAMNAEPDLWRNAADANVYIADEQSLYGALKIVSMTWTQVKQAQNHEEVFKLADEMIKRVGIFMDEYKKIGESLDKAYAHYEEGRKKLVPERQSIIQTSKKLIELGAKNSSAHPITEISDS